LHTRPCRPTPGTEPSFKPFFESPPGR
jgi:hypothetical protein